MNATGIVRTVVNHWKSGVDARDPAAVARVFNDDAIFQGLHSYSIGRAGIAEYYESQPLGLKADYDILESRRLTDDLVLGHLKLAFSFADLPTLEVFLGVIARQIGDVWRIDHYQVSKVD